MLLKQIVQTTTMVAGIKALISLCSTLLRSKGQSTNDSTAVVSSTKAWKGVGSLDAKHRDPNVVALIDKGLDTIKTFTP